MKLRIGMVGAGFIADRHCRGFAALPDAEAVGICQDFHGDAGRVAGQRERLRAKAAELGLTAYDSFDAMAADPGIDALIIGSVNPLHHRQIVAGLRAGKHLLVEKPVVTDPAQLDEIAALAREAGRVVFPGHNFVYRGAVRRAREAMDGGRLGRVLCSSFVSIHTTSDDHARGWRGDRKLASGGTLMDSGHHLVYQALHLLGMPRAVQAFTARMVRTEMECEDLAQVSLQFPDGSVAVLLQSIASSHGGVADGIRIVGDRGSLAVTDGLYLDGLRAAGGGDDTGYDESFAGQARAFVDAVVSGKPPASTLDDARHALRVIDAAYRSAESGTVVVLD